MYTAQNTFREILEDPRMQGRLPMALSPLFVDVIPEQDRSLPLETLEQRYTMPWGLPFPAQTVVDAANMILQVSPGGPYRFVPLWQETEPKNWFPSLERTKDCTGLMVPNAIDDVVRPAAIIVPGGAYREVAFPNEGCHTLYRLEEKGYRGFILNYRCDTAKYPAPQNDLAMAILYLRANADRYKIDPNDILIVGYSAGGHLCASETLYAGEYAANLTVELVADCPELAKRYMGLSARANKVCLCYPVISFVHEPHEDSFQCLTGGDESLRDKMSLERHVTRDYPKTFVWTCADDSLVPPSNGIRMGEALQKAGAPCRLEVYPTGEHGCATGEGTSAAGWVDTMVEYMKSDRP